MNGATGELESGFSEFGESRSELERLRLEATGPQPWPERAAPASRRRPLGALRELLARGLGTRPRTPAGEVNAAACLEMFLCAALGRSASSTTCLATALFALGALDAAADRAALGRASRRRLEARFIEGFYGTGGRQTEAWRRALHDLERTRAGWAIRRRGEAALHAWLHGEPPAPYLERALAS